MSRHAFLTGKRRVVAASVSILALLALALPLAPAFADDPPPLVWTAVTGFPLAAGDLGDLEITFETASAVGNPFGEGEALDPTPLQRVKVVNNSDHTRRFGLGIDIGVQGQIEQLWLDAAWGLFADPAINRTFTFSVDAGQTAYFMDGGLPAYSGRTGVLYELTDPLVAGGDDVATELARHSTQGGFVPVDLTQRAGDFLPVIGREATVAGPGEQPELFPGAIGTVEASGLPRNLPVELWIAPDLDYLWFQVMGGNLPVTSRKVGAATTSADGSLAATFVVPGDVEIGESYQLVVGVRAEHYWPAGMYHSFDITSPTSTLSVPVAPEAVEASLPLNIATVDFAFPAGTGGTWTATESLTGPVPNEFELAGVGATKVYYHLDTTATLTAPATVCLTYDVANLPGETPRLYHFAQTPEPHWVDITTTREPGKVCGETTSFSPFALGYPLDDGSKVKPGKGVLSSDNGWDNGLQDGDYNITMNLWYGENARIVRLLENGVVIGEQTLTRHAPDAQKAVFPVTGRVNGSHVYTAELENSRGVTTTAPVTVKVTQANPAVPVLSATTPKNGAFTLTANLWWGTNATSYRFVEGGAVVANGTLTAATPNEQTATLTVTGKAKGVYSYVVQFTNGSGTTSSAVLKVTVK